MPFFFHDDIQFHYRDIGSGIPFVFQHGLGADSSQPCGLFQPPPGFRLISLDCRAHGETRPLGATEKIAIDSFAEDLRALLDQLRISRAIIGGISMGAAIALNFALRFPDRLLGLILSRPAWLDTARTDSATVFAVIAQLIREHGAQRGAELFQRSETYRTLCQQSPTSAVSLLVHFAHPRAEETVVKLEQIPQYNPTRTRSDWKSVSVPTLVLANRCDAIHPFEYGEVLAKTIPAAEFREITSKSLSVERHCADVQQAIEEFLLRRFSARSERARAGLSQ